MARKNRNRNKTFENKETTMTEDNQKATTENETVEHVETPVVENVEAVDSVETPVAENVESVEQTPTEETLDAVQQTEEDVETIQELPDHLQKLDDVLKNYTEQMKPRAPIEKDTGASVNYVLWKTLEDVVNTEDNASFKDKYKLVNKYFNDYKDGAFGPLYLFRFSEYWRWSVDELDAFHRLLNVIVLTCDPAKRQEGLKQVDLNKALSEGFTEQAKQNITNFLMG